MHTRTFHTIEVYIYIYIYIYIYLYTGVHLRGGWGGGLRPP